jgi:ribosomal protein S18 acetylase RimI-like enzyme
VEFATTTQESNRKLRVLATMQVEIRDLAILDIYQLHKMYGSLSETSKRYFHPAFLGFDSINVYWFVLQILLCFSTIRALTRLLCSIFKRSILFPMVAVSHADKQVIGFAYLIPRGRISDNKRSAGLSVVVRDYFQGMGIGSMLLRSLLVMSKKENIRRLSLTVLPDNHAAIRLYEKHGFRRVRLVKGRHSWRGRRYDAVLMERRTRRR